MMRNKTREKDSSSRNFAVGVIVLALAVIGLISVFGMGVRFTGRLLDNTKEKEQFERLTLPVVMFDPVPFESPQDADPLMLLQSSLWATLLDEKSQDYLYDEWQQLLIPVSDVDVSCAKLFGSDITLTHQTFGNYEVTYLYDEELQAYHVPVAYYSGLYTPRVEEIQHSGDVYLVTVGYVPPTSAWTVITQGEDGVTQPDKYMIYEFHKNGDDYNLRAIRYLDGQGVGGSENHAQTTVPVQPAGESDLEETAGLSEEETAGLSDEEEAAGLSDEAQDEGDSEEETAGESDTQPEEDASSDEAA